MSEQSDPPPAGLADGPAPASGGRKATLALLVACLLGSSALVASLLGEARYGLQAPEPVDLGALEAADLTPAVAGRYVRATAPLSATAVVPYERRAEPDGFAVAAVEGLDGVWVDYRVPAKFAGPRFVAPRQLSGRLVPIADLGVRHQGMAAAIAKKGGAPKASPGGGAEKGGAKKGGAKK